MALDVSYVEPPPTANTHSILFFLQISIPSITLVISGLALTPGNSKIVILCFLRASTILSYKPIFLIDY